MYLSIIILPLISSISSGFLGRKLGVSGAQLTTSTSVIITTFLAITCFFEAGLNSIPVSIKLSKWLDSESLYVLWAFQFDSLTVSMLIPVLIVSSLVHIYSVGYMSHDPHNQRFFSYLSLFTFMMIILVTANSYLFMFVGWEGRNTCLKWYNNFHGKILHRFSLKKFFHVKSETNKRLRSDRRIGPHEEKVISVLIGSILGDSHLEKREKGIGTRIIFEQCNRNIEYIMWFHKFFYTRGYCTPNKPKLTSRIKKGNKVFYQYRVSSYTFTSFNWLHDMFYKKSIKIIPINIGEYITPLSLAIWFMDDGSKTHNTVRLATNCFKLSELEFLCKLLKDKFNLDLSVHKSGKNKRYILYVKKSSLTRFIDLVKPHMLPSMYYKLGL